MILKAYIFASTRLGSSHPTDVPEGAWAPSG
jgi:hypothetical protein